MVFVELGKRARCASTNRRCAWVVCRLWAAPKRSVARGEKKWTLSDLSLGLPRVPDVSGGPLASCTHGVLTLAEFFAMTFVPDTDLPQYDPKVQWPEWGEKIWRGFNALAVHSLFHTANMFDAMRVKDTERTTQIEVLREMCYDTAHPDWCKLDVWRPVGVGAEHKAPCVMFTHGGGFRTMSKDTHWMMARGFARMGYVVVTIDYRLGPMHPYPAAVEDASAAYQWVLREGEALGVDLDRIVLAGESAGANLSHALTMGLHIPRPEPWARPLYAATHKPVGVIAACGLLQVSHPERLLDYGVSRVAMIPIKDAAKSYIGGAREEEDLDFANPLLWTERASIPKRAPLPPFFIPVGTDDPLLGDSERLARALERLCVPHELVLYEGKGHSFMAFLWDSQAKQCWRDMARFLNRVFGLKACQQTAA